MRESTIEKHLRERVEAAGGLIRKFVSPGHVGVPDRIVMWPEGVVDFVELKAPGKKLSPAQEREHSRFDNLGSYVYVLDCVEAVNHYIEGRTS